jgi:SOS response regulatory protein OraA/RecX
VPPAPTSPIKQIFNYACRSLARRRLTVHEIRQKLQKRFPDFPDESEEIINKFLKLHYLDDAEYVRLFIKDQLARKPQGLRNIQYKLRQKGLSKELIENNLKGEETDELELAKQAVAKKLKTLKASSPLQKKQKLFRFLASRGFKPDAIIRAIKAQESPADYSADLSGEDA